MKNHFFQKEIEMWFAKAEDDLSVAQAIIKEHAPPWAACLHCHQVAEKALKALLLYKTSSYPKEHNLLKLRTLLEKNGRPIPEIEEDLITMAPYYVETRYPTTKEYQLNPTKAKEAVERAENVLKFVTKQLNKK